MYDAYWKSQTLVLDVEILYVIKALGKVLDLGIELYNISNYFSWDFLIS
jgi:hypothetical protein